MGNMGNIYDDSNKIHVYISINAAIGKKVPQMPQKIPQSECEQVSVFTRWTW